MEYSFAQILMPLFGLDEMVRVRVYLKDKHAFDILPSIRSNRQMSLKTPTGNIYMTDFSKNKTDVFHAPIKQVIQKYFPNATEWLDAKPEDFRFVSLEPKPNTHWLDDDKVEEKSVLRPLWLYGDEPKYPDNHKKLEEYLEGERTRMPTVMNSLFHDGIMYASLRAALPHSWRKTFKMNLWSPVKNTSNAVFLSSGAIYDYSKQKVLAPSLDDWLRQFLDLSAETPITLQHYLDHICINNISLQYWINKIDLNKSKTMERKLSQQYWKDMMLNLKSQMPFCNEDYYIKKRPLRQIEIMAVYPNRMEEYVLDSCGFRRNFPMAPIKNQNETWDKEQRDIRNKWYAPLSVEELDTLLATPDVKWYARSNNSRYIRKSPHERVKPVLP